MPYLEAPPLGTSHFHPMDLVGACTEHGKDRVLLGEGALPPAFFDLSSGLAGDLMQRLVNYRLRAAAVTLDLPHQSPAFQAFAREANRSGTLRFFPSREAAVAWLASEG